MTQGEYGAACAAIVEVGGFEARRSASAWASGLIQGAYFHVGVKLPRTTFDQVNVGTPIYSESRLLPGDLLFIPGSDGTPEAPGHVGMYIGNGLLIQVPQTGDVVKARPLNQWQKSIAAMRRISEPFPVTGGCPEQLLRVLP